MDFSQTLCELSSWEYFRSWTWNFFFECFIKDIIQYAKITKHMRRQDMVPYWPQLRYCMFIWTWTQAYLEKCLCADFQKLRRATAMITLSVVRESIVWILNLLFERQRQSCTERIRSLWLQYNFWQLHAPRWLSHQIAINASHICHLGFSSSHIRKSKKRNRWNWDTLSLILCI